jgi:hypothetical protein
MPNWVYNTLTVEGEISPVAMFKAKVSAPYEVTSSDYNLETQKRETKTFVSEEVLSFWNIIRPPANKLGLYHAVSNGTEDKIWGWYNWNNNNWGTKWDACNPEITEETQNKVIYRFDTAWSQPTPVLEQATTDYPDLTFTLEYEEEQGWGGKVIVKAGELISSEFWDIPNSHEELTSRGKECWCSSDYYQENEEDKPFSDCPKNPNKESVEA